MKIGFLFCRPTDSSMNNGSHVGDVTFDKMKVQAHLVSEGKITRLVELSDKEGKILVNFWTRNIVRKSKDRFHIMLDNGVD